MREILFRGKAKAGYKWIAEGAWIEGSLFYSNNENGTVCQIATSYLSESKDESVMVVAYEVAPETVCQYTGLTDKNGRKIFEGDILRFDDCSNYPVVWDSDYCAFGSCWYSDFDHLSKYRNVELVVVGNIFDNQELLEE